ncbi:RES family NAD+ phosphorylase [Spirosoma sp. SC4-14]|uniref:RES family NAD+ phosphorylase n=1 Tax=Spirosoma sp. SC4-14 TaxID=3128900 RepID=UPI0030D26A84
MEVYRVTRQQYATDLSGNGAALYGGRWNEPGQPALYTASSRLLTLLETLVHMRQRQLPTDYRIMVLYIPDDLPVTMLTTHQLPENWQTNEAHSQQTGSQPILCLLMCNYWRLNLLNLIPAFFRN